MATFDLGDGIQVRLALLHHAEAVYRTVEPNREHLGRWLPWAWDCKGPEDIRAFIRQCLQWMAEGKMYLFYLWDGDEVIGSIDVHAVNLDHSTGGVGYWLSQAYTGRGIMTRAAQAIVDFAFGELGLNRVYLRCATGNHASCAIAERLGFQLEGILREEMRNRDHFDDMKLYAMLAREWRERGPLFKNSMERR